MLFVVFRRKQKIEYSSFSDYTGSSDKDAVEYPHFLKILFQSMLVVVSQFENVRWFNYKLVVHETQTISQLRLLPKRVFNNWWADAGFSLSNLYSESPNWTDGPQVYLVLKPGV